MERRKYTDYKPILEYIFNKLAPSLRPRTVLMTDFEFTLQKAFLTVLPYLNLNLNLYYCMRNIFNVYIKNIMHTITIYIKYF